MRYGSEGEKEARRRMASFRSIIKDEAARRGISGYRLAQMSGVPMRSVQQYLADDADLRGERVAALADALGLGLRPISKRGKERSNG